MPYRRQYDKRSTAKTAGEVWLQLQTNKDDKRHLHHTICTFYALLGERVRQTM